MWLNKTKVFQPRIPGLLRLAKVIKGRQVAFLLKEVGLLSLLFQDAEQEATAWGWSPQGHS